MTTGQIWLAIVLGFIVLITIASKFSRGLSRDGRRHVVDELAQFRAETGDRLRELNDTMTDVRTKVVAMERILEQVE